MQVTKVEIIQVERNWMVQITYREPFEDIFEIAQHVGRLESKLDAEHLRDRVLRAVGMVYPQSPRMALDELLWNWTSSVSDALYKAPRKGPVVFKTTAKTKAYIREMSQGG